jgi:hypothetical protein
MELLGFDSYDEVMKYHKRRVEDYLGNGKDIRDDKRTMNSIPPGLVINLMQSWSDDA